MYKSSSNGSDYAKRVIPKSTQNLKKWMHGRPRNSHETQKKGIWNNKRVLLMRPQQGQGDEDATRVATRNDRTDSANPIPEQKDNLDVVRQRYISGMQKWIASSDADMSVYAHRTGSFSRIKQTLTEKCLFKGAPPIVDSINFEIQWYSFLDKESKYGMSQSKHATPSCPNPQYKEGSRDAVNDGDGYMYDRRHITTHSRQHVSSPFTQTFLSSNLGHNNFDDFRCVRGEGNRTVYDSEPHTRHVDSYCAKESHFPKDNINGNYGRRHHRGDSLSGYGDSHSFNEFFDFNY